MMKENKAIKHIEENSSTDNKICSILTSEYCNTSDMGYLELMQPSLTIKRINAKIENYRAVTFNVLDRILSF